MMERNFIFRQSIFMSRQRLLAFGIPVTIFVVVLLTVVNFQRASRSSILGDGSETAYLLVNREEGRPESEQEFWSLANRMLQPGDFDEDWMQDSFTLYVGTDVAPTSWPYEEVLALSVCSTPGRPIRGKRDQQPLCFEQEITKFQLQDDAREQFDNWWEGPLINDSWDEDTDLFDLIKLVDGIKSNCGDAIAQPSFGYYEITNFCEIKMVHDEYFVLVDFRFSLDEQPVSWEEMGELVNLIQKKLVDPNADDLPVGLRAPISFDN